MSSTAVFPYLDEADLQRAHTTVDDEGAASETWTSLGTRLGAWGSSSSRGRTSSSRPGQQVDAHYSGPFYDAKVGDRLVGLHDETYEIVDFHDTKWHRRYFLRRVDG